MRKMSIIGASQIFQSSGLHSLLELYHQQPCKQYSKNNAWNLNTNSNLNNNNKYNSNRVVPCAELVETSEKRYAVPLGDIYDAYYECIVNKGRTANAMYFTLNLEKNIRDLWRSINDRTYTIGRSIAFIVTYPIRREVFAADFRDRVVHDWICMRLNPLFEGYLPANMTSNRKGKGNLYAIDLVYDLMEEMSNGYTEDAWIWKFDLQGFFMSIDKRLLNSKLQKFIDERYFGPDKDTLKWLSEKVIMNCPQKNCIRKSPMSAWEGLAKNKSLFGQDDYHGMPIGNLPSQLFANFLLKDMVDYLAINGFKCVQYVDDVVVIHKSKPEILAFIPTFREWLSEHLHATLHPQKCYIQHYAKGVSFVGAIIKPHREYLSHRTRRNALAKTGWLARGGGNKEEVRSTTNSYLGISRNFYTYKLRKTIADMLFTRFGKAISFNNNYYKLIIN